MTEEWEELEEELDDVYNEKVREKEVDEGELEDWEGAWMDGYDKA